jgi:hypothetical protein
MGQSRCTVTLPFSFGEQQHVPVPSCPVSLNHFSPVATSQIHAHVAVPNPPTLAIALPHGDIASASTNLGYAWILWRSFELNGSSILMHPFAVPTASIVSSEETSLSLFTLRKVADPSNHLRTSSAWPEIAQGESICPVAIRRISQIDDWELDLAPEVIPGAADDNDRGYCPREWWEVPCDILPTQAERSQPRNL